MFRSYVDFGEGEFKKTLRLQTVDDEEPEDDETFHIVLTSVTSSSGTLTSTSPLLQESTSTATIQIQDNDLPYGILSFAPSSRNILVSEEDGSVRLEVQRTDGTLSTATVEVLTLGGKMS